MKRTFHPPHPLAERRIQGQRQSFWNHCHNLSVEWDAMECNQSVLSRCTNTNRDDEFHKRSDVPQYESRSEYSGVGKNGAISTLLSKS